MRHTNRRLAVKLPSLHISRNRRLSRNRRRDENKAINTHIGGIRKMRRQHRSFYIGALAVTGVGLLGSALIPRAHADAWDKMTIVSVNEPIIAGNKVLDPGTYVWKLLNSPSNQHIVQI